MGRVEAIDKINASITSEVPNAVQAKNRENPGDTPEEEQPNDHRFCANAGEPERIIETH